MIAGFLRYKNRKAQEAQKQQMLDQENQKPEKSREIMSDFLSDHPPGMTKEEYEMKKRKDSQKFKQLRGTLLQKN